MTSRDRITCFDFSFTTQNRLKKSEKYAVILENEMGENYGNRISVVNSLSKRGE